MGGARMSEDRWRVSNRDLADLFGVSHQAIHLWSSRDGCPRNEDGSYDLGSVLRWREAWKKGGSGGKGAKGDLDLRYEQARLNRARADAEELKLAVSKRELVPVEVVKRDVARILGQSRTRWLQLPGALAQQLAGEERPEAVLGVLERAVDENLRELAGFDVMAGGDDQPQGTAEGAEGAETATAKRKPRPKPKTDHHKGTKAPRTATAGTTKDTKNTKTANRRPKTATDAPAGTPAVQPRTATANRKPKGKSGSGGVLDAD